MQHELRRKDRAMNLDDAVTLLRGGEYGILATVDAEGWPYAVPLSYVCNGGKIYFHCAGDGHKIKNLQFNSNACFTVVGKTQPVYTKSLTTYYESVIAFGTIREVKDEMEKRYILLALSEKYLPDCLDKAEEALPKSLKRTTVLVMDVEKFTGKENKPA